MSKGQKPDYIVKLPVGDIWHRLGAAWNTQSGGVSIVLDVGTPIVLQPGTKLVLVPPKPEEGD